MLATRAIEEGSQVYQRLEITTTPDIERQPFEAYRLNIIDAQGSVVADGVWNARGWKVGFTPTDGLMTHDLSNIDNPPMDTT